MMETISQIIDRLPEILSALTSIVAGASVFVAMTDTPKDDKIVGKIYKIIEFLAINIGKAKQKSGGGGTQPKDPPGGNGD